MCPTPKHLRHLISWLRVGWISNLPLELATTFFFFCLRRFDLIIGLVWAALSLSYNLVSMMRKNLNYLSFTTLTFLLPFNFYSYTFISSDSIKCCNSTSLTILWINPFRNLVIIAYMSFTTLGLIIAIFIFLW
jgi:hypothetical protein